MSNMTRRKAITAVVWAVCTPIAISAEIPNEFESDIALFDRLYSYFGGVATFSLSRSATLAYSGNSMEINIQFQPSFFSVAGVGLGALVLKPPMLAVPANADYFSITIISPAEGQLSLYIQIREDDNADGMINLGAGDDEWESPTLMLLPGTNVYNIAFTDFFNTTQGSGNGLINFTTTQAMGVVINLESSVNLPGGLITAPTTLFMDHTGFYAGPQQLPALCLGDSNMDGVVDFNDITVILSNWLNDYGLASGPGDADGDGVVIFADLTRVLSNWLSTCL